jgi:hypothetical protein
MNEKDKKVVEFLKAQRFFMADKTRYRELTELISAFENDTYSSDMSEEELPHKVYLNIQMALGGWSLFLSKSDILERLTKLDKDSKGVSPKPEILIVGGSALALLGEPRLTSDIDYLGSLDYLPKEYLASLGFSNNVKTFFSLYETNEYTSLELTGFRNLTVRVLSYEDLAVMKLFSTRTKDLEDLIQYIFPKLDSYSSLKQKIETYKSYSFFNSGLPELNLNQMDLIKQRLREEKKVLIVEDFSISLVDFLKSIRLLTYTQQTFGADSLSPWLDKPLVEVTTRTSLLGYLCVYKGLKILI